MQPWAENINKLRLVGQGPTLIAREAAVLNTCGRRDAFNANCNRAYTYFNCTYGGINPGRVEKALTMESTPWIEALQARRSYACSIEVYTCNKW